MIKDVATQIELCGFRHDVICLLHYIIKLMNRNGGTIDPDLNLKITELINLVQEGNSTQNNTLVKLQEILDAVNNNLSLLELNDTIKEGFLAVEGELGDLRSCICPAITKIANSLDSIDGSLKLITLTSVGQSNLRLSFTNVTEETDRVVYTTSADLKMVEGYHTYSIFVGNIGIDKPIVVIDVNGNEFPVYITADKTQPMLASDVDDSHTEMLMRVWNDYMFTG